MTAVCLHFRKMRISRRAIFNLETFKTRNFQLTRLLPRNSARNLNLDIFKKRNMDHVPVKRPPALVLTRDSSFPGPHSAGHAHHGHPGGSSPGWKVTFPEIEIHSPKDDPGDNASISSRGTSSTVGYRYVIYVLGYGRKFERWVFAQPR